MFRNFITYYQKLRDDKRYCHYIDMLTFVLIISVIHYLYVFFTSPFNFAINRIFGIYNWFHELVFDQSRFILRILVPVKAVGQKFVFENNDYIDILFPCTGIQPILQFALLIFLYPGPWKHKLWYIPVGMIMIHLTNVIRIAGLGVVMAYWPENWQYAHDYPFRVIIYVVLFILWLIWNDKFYHAERIKAKNADDLVKSPEIQ